MPTPVLWPYRADWDGRVREGYGYQTDVNASRNNTEQRAGLRSHPVGYIDFQFVCTERQDAQAASALLLGNQAKTWLVPLIQYKCPLTADVAIDAQVLPCVTAGAPFQDPLGLGIYVLIWKDPKTWEVCQISAIQANSVDLQAGTVKAWLAYQAVVIPLRIGRLDRRVSKAWPSGASLRGNLRFTFDSAEDAESAGQFIIWDGLVMPVQPE